MRVERIRASVSRLWRVPLALAGIGALIAAGVGCGDDDDGETLSVVASAEGTNLKTVDLGPQGKSSGDIYVFDSPLLDAEEEETIGKVHGSQTSIALDGGSETVQAMITYDFGDGDRITVGGIGEYPRGEAGLVKEQEFERPILGGTGEYAGADGTVTSVRRADESYEHTFEIQD
jgi:hypothetical protein